MKILSFLFLTFILFSCSGESKNYFVFDEVVHYKLNSEIIDAGTIFSLVPKNKIDSLQKNIIIGNKPFELMDSTFIENLGSVGFEKMKVNPFNYEKISKIYRDKYTLFKTSITCEPIFRDILVFKKNNKSIGISKICFECLKTENVGTKGKLPTLQRESDYKKLEILIQ